MRTRALASMIGVLAVGVGSTSNPVPSGAADDVPIEFCIGEAITPEEAARGEVVEVTCTDDPFLLAPQASMVLSHHWDQLGGGSQLTITGSSCSHVVSFGSGHSWNNRIQSTQPRACGNVKHFDNANQTGDNEVISGSTRQALTSMRGRTSSMNYS